MSRLISAVLRNSVPMLPNPPEFDTAAAIAAGAAKTAIGPGMIGTSMPRTSHSTVESIVRLQRVMSPAKSSRSDTDKDAHHCGEFIRYDGGRRKSTDRRLRSLRHPTLHPAATSAHHS